jgi:hypothetical protein
MCALMLFAGHETTTTLISSGMLALLENPDQLELLRDDPSLADKAVEEMLRYDGPIKVLIRWVTQDTRLGGEEIKAGERVYLLLQAANRDSEKFADADRFDIQRRPNPHVGFGRGVHTCIGALLARIETRVAIPALLARLPNVRRLEDHPLRWEDSLASRALRDLHVAYDVPRAVAVPGAPFVASTFDVPQEVRTERVWLRPLTIDDAARDYDAVMSSVRHLQRQFRDTWPEGLSLQQNLVDLGWHQKRFQRRDAFTYTVLDPEGTRVLGCVYVDPPADGGDAEVTLWVRASEVAGGLDAHLERAVRDWIARDWPFVEPRFPGREG